MNRVAPTFELLQARAVEAAYRARTPGTMLQVQRDIVTGAERCCRLAAREGDAVTLARAAEYLEGARAALARLEERERLEPAALELPHG